jgi:hypothetical protein
LQTAIGINNINYKDVHPQIDRIKKPTIFFAHGETFRNNWNEEQLNDNDDAHIFE